jgi:threonine/homoserine/homoserine lactone efflux protein
MPDLTLWGLFVVASMVLLLKPGPAVLYIVARSVEQGRAAGLVSVLGIHLDTIIHITAAAVRLSALIVSSALAFWRADYAWLPSLFQASTSRFAFARRVRDCDAPSVR